MAEVHGLLGRVVLVLVLVTAAWAGALVAARRPVQPALVGGLVWVVILVWLTGLLGVAEAVAVGAPDDALHIVYGGLTALVLPGAWAIARTRPDPRRTALVVAVASIVQVILVVRLFQTGG
jgi:hypothetical protein